MPPYKINAVDRKKNAGKGERERERGRERERENKCQTERKAGSTYDTYLVVFMSVHKAGKGRGDKNGKKAVMSNRKRETKLLQKTSIHSSRPVQHASAAGTTHRVHRRPFVAQVTKLTGRARVEGVVVDVVAATAKADANPVLDVLENVVEDLRIERFQDGDTSVLHVVHVVVCRATPRNKTKTHGDVRKQNKK